MGKGKNENQDVETNKYDITNSKKYIYNLLILVIGIGLLVPFASQFLVPFIFQWNGKKILNIPGADVWSTYVSIVLGIVATVASVVSLVLSFKNTDDAKETSVETMKNLTSISIRMDQIMKDQEKMSHEQSEVSKDIVSIKDKLDLNKSNSQTVETDNLDDLEDFDDKWLDDAWLLDDTD